MGCAGRDNACISHVLYLSGYSTFGKDFFSESDLISSVIFMIFLLPFVHQQGASAGARTDALHETILHAFTTEKAARWKKTSGTKLRLMQNFDCMKLNSLVHLTVNYMIMFICAVCLTEQWHYFPHPPKNVYKYLVHWLL